VAEILDGELFTSPRPASPHALAASMLGADLIGAFGHEGGGGTGPGGWWLLDEPELHLAEDVLVPDLAGWRRQRMPAVPDVASFDLPPDWVCEVISPGTEGMDRGRKRRIYARAAVSYLWFLNPLVQTLEVFRLVNGAWTEVGTFVGNEPVRAPPFENVELRPVRWWLRAVSG
jgi:Uma2 family endonuclease